jgi:hypothetical protein
MKWGYEDTSSIEAHKNNIKAMKELNVKRLIDWSTPTVKFKMIYHPFQQLLLELWHQYFCQRQKWFF